MGLEIRKGRDGKPRRHWYGRYDVDGKAHVVNLGVPIRGTIPQSLLDLGGAEFEASRARAEAKLAEARAEAQERGNADHLTRRLIASKTGATFEDVRLCELADRWRAVDRDGGAPSEKHLQWCASVFKRFADAVPVVFLYEVNAGHIGAFLDAIRAGHTEKTTRDIATLLQGAFARFLPHGVQNPFKQTIRRKRARSKVDGGPVARRPLTDTELQTLLETARGDAMLYPLAVCAAATGLRIGDVCLLRWASVDLRGGWVSVATGKTGAQIEAPIFADLRAVFETALTEKKEGAVYVWPDAARMYRANPQGIVYRGKALFARAIAEAQGGPEMAEIATDAAPPADVWQRASDAVAAGLRGDKRDRILDTLRRVAAGASYGDIHKATERAKAVCSQDLRDAEIVSGLTLRRRATDATGRDIKTLIGATRQTRTRGAVSASLLGWHNLRGTFVTRALSRGIPFETVAKITGHGTAKIMRDHYFNPTREHTRDAMQRAQIAGGTPAAPAAPDPLAGLADAVKSLSQTDRAKLAKMLNEKGA
jgi:integrase